MAKGKASKPLPKENTAKNAVKNAKYLILPSFNKRKMVKIVKPKAHKYWHEAFAQVIIMKICSGNTKYKTGKNVLIFTFLRHTNKSKKHILYIIKLPRNI